MKILKAVFSFVLKIEFYTQQLLLIYTT